MTRTRILFEIAKRPIALLTRSPPPDAARMRPRLALAMSAFGLCYAVIALRLVTLALSEPEGLVSYIDPGEAVSHARPDIYDATGNVLATDIQTPSLFAEPHRIVDVDETIEQITAVLPGLNAEKLRKRLTGDRRFVWLKRELTPTQKAQLHEMGIPGIGFLDENRRIYPSGPTTAHVLGHVDVDNKGIAGIERHIDQTWLGALHEAGLARRTVQKPVQLTIDIRVQHAVRDELLKAIDKFNAKAAGAVVLNARTGEIAAMVSLPDYDPNDRAQALDEGRMNRMTAGVFELGSTFKAFTVAMALDTGRIRLGNSYDARRPIKVASFTIDDFHAQRRILTVPEIFIHSSNIGTARMALDVGVEGHKEFLKRLGFFGRPAIELPETAKSMVPARWGQLNSMTISFGHGLSVAPLQAAVAAAALVNGGHLLRPTLFPRDEVEAMLEAQRVLKPETSRMMRYLMRLNVEEGTAGKAEVPGYRVGGKTGTAEKVVRGRYSNNKLLTSFLGTFPADKPQYVVFAMLDEPKGIKETHGYRTSGWNAVPTAGRIIERIAPMLGVRPAVQPVSADQIINVSY